MVHSSVNNTIFLESVIEYTAGFPAELQRLLATIRQLDVKSEGLKKEVESKVLRVRQMAGGVKNKDGPDQQALMAEIKTGHELLLQWADERVQIANTAYDLVEHYTDRVERDLGNFDDEIRASEDVMGYEDLGYTPREPPLSTRQSGRHAVLQAAGIDPPVLSMPSMGRGGGDGPTPTGIARGRSSAAAAMDMDAGMDFPKASRASKATRLSGPPGAGPYGGMEIGGNPGHIQAGAGAMDMGMASMGGGGGFVPQHGSFINPPPEDLKQASASVQTTGRFLEYNDVGPNLRGRLAELFWPDDGYWYLIEIQDVNASGNSMTAHIMYMTGDTEELQLGDIIRDKHMHLIVR